MTKRAQFSEANEHLKSFVSYFFLVTVTKKAKTTVPKDHLFCCLLHYFPRYLQKKKKSLDDWLERSRRFAFLLYTGNIYINSPTILRGAD